MIKNPCYGIVTKSTTLLPFKNQGEKLWSI